MPPQKLLECLEKVQAASNSVTIAHIAVSHAIGEYIEFLGSDEPLTEASKYVSNIQRCFGASAEALAAYCDATTALSKLREEDMLYE